MCCQSQELKEEGKRHPDLGMDGNGKWRRTRSILCPGTQEKTLRILEMGVISSGNGYLLSVFSFLVPHLVSQSTVYGSDQSGYFQGYNV